MADKNYCYILRHKKYNKLTYNGFTNNPNRRIRQHNGEISGGANETTKVEPGWEFFVLMTGFETQSNALSCEWKIKYPKKRRKCLGGPINRVKSLNDILQLDKWTSLCDIPNNICQYRLYITSDMIQHINVEVLPNNIKVYTMDRIIPDLCV